MRYRQFFHNGKPTDRVDATDGATFGVTDEVGIEEVAAALGVDPSEVSAVVSNDEPKHVAVTIPPAEPFVEEPSKLDQLIAAIEAAGSAELKAAVRGLK